MADQTSPAIGRPGTTLPAVQMDVTPKTYDFTFQSGRPIDRVVQLVSGASWQVAFPAGGNYVAVAPGQPYAIELSNETTTVGFKADAGTPSLTVLIAK